MTNDESFGFLDKRRQMKPFLIAAVFSASVALGVPVAAQQAFVASGDAPEAAIGGEQQWGTGSDIVFTAWAADSDLFAGTEGPYDTTTAGRICIAGVSAAGARACTSRAARRSSASSFRPATTTSGRS